MVIPLLQRKVKFPTPPAGFEAADPSFAPLAVTAVAVAFGEIRGGSVISKLRSIGQLLPSKTEAV